ncbi:MAG: GntR family transcriptional regulator [Proteobacteria bacterium]|nr:GntR family transcriptional regulator [Pseudomonadota bacterium]
MQNSISSGEGLSASVLPAFERQRLHDSVVDHLRNFIVEGVLKGGTKLKERELCETLGISRTPLREAFKVLAAEGLVEISPNRGATVSSLSAVEVQDMFELMGGLEAFSGQLACERITPVELAEIKALHYAMLACRAQEDLSGYYTINRQIHDRINQAARNNALRQTYLSINRRLQAMRFRSNLQKTKWDSAIKDHEDMLSALEARDGQRLGAILRQHMLDKREAVLQLMLVDENGTASQ